LFTPSNKQQVEGVSDLDSFALVTRGGPAVGSVAERVAAAAAGVNRNGKYSKVETGVFEVSDVVARKLRSTGGFLPDEYVSAVPNRFVLKTQAVCIWGMDLPYFLPDSVARAEPQLLPRIRDDVERAMNAADKYFTQGDKAMCCRAVRWASKRLVRAAFEGVMGRAGVYTRDLYWCCRHIE
jgi:hypothetical protein